MNESWTGACAAGLGCFLLGSMADLAPARELTGSEAVRAERCAGDYVCDEDGSWQASYVCPNYRLAVVAPDQSTAAVLNRTSTRRSSGAERAESER
jgi:hypothetical protein